MLTVDRNVREIARRQIARFEKILAGIKSGHPGSADLARQLVMIFSEALDSLDDMEREREERLSFLRSDETRAARSRLRLIADAPSAAPAVLKKQNPAGGQ